MVQKKFIKIGVVAISMVALAIGLGVGISQSQNKNTTAANASVYAAYAECDDAGVSASGGGGKSGKSGPTSPSEGKSGKSGPTSPSEGKSGKSNSNRQLYPGTEDFVEASPTQRRKLRADLINGKCMFVAVALLSTMVSLYVLLVSIAIYCYSPTRYLTLISPLPLCLLLSTLH